MKETLATDDGPVELSASAEGEAPQVPTPELPSDPDGPVGSARPDGEIPPLRPIEKAEAPGSVASAATLIAPTPVASSEPRARLASESMPLELGAPQPLSHPDVVDSVAGTAVRRKRPRPGERRMQILQTLAEMLESPNADRVTTAALAARIQVSEAALYRHFASKAQMFEGLIDFIEHTLFGLINQITARDENGIVQLRSILTMLLSFAERNPGMTRVLIGDALVTENARLQARVNQIIDRLEVSLKQCFRIAIAQGHLPENTDAAGRANLMLACVLGRWLRFAKGGFKRAPTEGLDAQVMLLIT